MNPAITQSTGRELVITKNKLIENNLIAPLEKPPIIRGLAVGSSSLCWGSIGYLGYSFWSGSQFSGAVLAYQPLFECQHGDVPFLLLLLGGSKNCDKTIGIPI